MIAKGIFITGTDTGIGKTWFTVALMQALKKQGRNTLGMKPIASGAMMMGNKLINEDAGLILRHCSEPMDYELINPVVFEAPVAPGFAAKDEKGFVDLDQIRSCYEQLASSCENVVVEGVGGWRVPLSDKESIVDLARVLSLPIVMVVGLRLGCVNHAMLTAEAIRADGLNLCAWASNLVEKDYLQKKQTITFLNEQLDCPHIADFGYMGRFEPDKLAEKIDPVFVLKQCS